MNSCRTVRFKFIIYALVSMWVSSEHSVPLQISKTCKFYTRCCSASGLTESSIYTTVVFLSLCSWIHYNHCQNEVLTKYDNNIIMNLFVFLVPDNGAFFCKALMQEIAFDSCSALDHEHCHKKKISFT